MSLPFNLLYIKFCITGSLGRLVHVERQQLSCNIAEPSMEVLFWCPAASILTMQMQIALGRQTQELC